MTHRVLEELPEKTRNTAHLIAIVHWVELNGGNQLDYSRKGIVAGEQCWPERDHGQRQIAPRDGLQEMDPVWKWIMTGYELPLLTH